MHTPLCVLRYLGLMVVVVSRLSDRLAEAYGDQTQEQIAERARRAGHQIDRSMISKALADKLGPKPREATLQALAAGFRLDVRELRELVGRTGEDLGVYAGPEFSASLTRKQRRALDQLILAMVEGDDDAGIAEAEKMGVSTRDDMTLAARRGASTGRAQWERAQTLGEESQDDGGFNPA